MEIPILGSMVYYPFVLIFVHFGLVFYPFEVSQDPNIGKEKTRMGKSVIPKCTVKRVAGMAAAARRYLLCTWASSSI